MKDIQQLIKKNSQEGRYENIFPKTFTDAVKDKESGKSLIDILSSFNMYFLSYNGSREQTRLQVPMSIRKTGLWVTYVLYDKTVVTEWYAGEAIDDDSWKSPDNWRVGTNMLVGDISVSSGGYWVVNGVITTAKAQGEQGITPMLRVGSNNHLQASYTNGSSWVDVSTNPVYTQFRINNNKLEQSVDLGQTWTVVSDYIASWFRFTGTTGSSQADNVGKIQISRDNGVTWSDLSGEFTNSLHIKGYVATVPNLPSTAVQGDIYGVGPTYDPSDTEHTNPIYQLYVKDSTGWVNNGKFTSITAGVVQTTGTSTTEVMSQKAVTDELGLLSKSLFNSFVFAGADLAYGVVYINDKYLSSSGNLLTFVGYKTTDFIFVKGQSQVEYIGAGHKSGIATCFYDKDKIFISSIVGHGNTTINVPVNAFYLRTSTNKTTEPYVQIIAKQDSDTSKFINSEVESLTLKALAVGVEIVRLHNHNLTFSGYVGVNSATPSYSANKAYIAIESGTILGLSNVQRGQIIIDSGAAFSVQSIKSLTDYYTKSQIDQYFSSLSNLFAFAGVNSASNTTYTLGYINSSGVAVGHTSYEYTDFINVLGQETVTVTGHSAKNTTFLCFYDINKAFIAGSAYAGSAANATLTVPSEAYYLRGTVIVGHSRLSVILNKDVDVASLKYQEKLSVTSEQIEDSVRISNSIKETLDLNPIGGDLMSGLSLITNSYINYSGNKTPNETASYCISPTIRLNNVKKIKYKGHLRNNTAIGFYSSDVVNSGTLVGIVKSSDQVDNYTIDINVPEGAKYIVASSSTVTIPTLQLEIVELYPVTPYNEIDEQVSVNTSDIAILKGYGMDRVPYFTREFCRHIFNSAICIGDSITQGWRTTGVFLNESYPAYLAKITGWTVMNAGQGGQTPIGWMANQFASHDYTNYDVAVICLGQNQGLTDTIDADTTSGDYNTYANTNTGQYCRIIEAIRAVNPEIKMMLLSRKDNGVDTTWNVVYKIGLKYDIPVVSFVTNGIDDLTKTEYHPHSDTVHFGTIGNLAIANVVSKSIEKYVYDNMSDFATYKE